MNSASIETDGVEMLLRKFHLTTMARMYPELAVKASENGWSHSEFLRELCQSEAQDRRERKLGRLIRESELPADKTLANLQIERLSNQARRRLSELLEGGFVDRCENVLCFGLPGLGKSHYLAAIGRELVLTQQRSVLFIKAFKLVARLVQARNENRLESALRKFDRIELVILDDIGYVQQDRHEAEVLFTFLSERYERGSVMISSNLVFSKWDQIFKDEMTTMAAIDRLVHRAVILEFSGQSYRKSAK